MLTENFSRDEFACKCGCGFDSIDDRLVHRLQVVRDIIGPIVILSGCRCENHNRKIGGRPASYHLRGMAADWRPADASLLMKCADLIYNWSGGFKYYFDRQFIHTDIGPRRRW